LTFTYALKCYHQKCSSPHFSWQEQERAAVVRWYWLSRTDRLQTCI